VQFSGIHPNSTISQTLNLIGGNVYTLFAEGIVSKPQFFTTVDYFLPPSFNLRVFHASPNVPGIDALVDGSSYGFNGVAFTANTKYTSFVQGTHNFIIQPTNQKSPIPYINTTLPDLLPFNDYSIFFVGKENGTNGINGTGLQIVTLEDNNSLPPNGGDIKLRFVHASLNTPAISLLAKGGQIFGGMTYKSVSNYTILQANVYSFELLVVGTQASVLSASFDLRVKDPQAKAVYTLVAEGILNPQAGEPKLGLYIFLDNGEGPPQASSSGSPGGLSGVEIGLIIASVAIFVILVAAGGFVFWKRRHQRAGYTEIEAHAQ